mgnify:CR=1 FL=1
MAAIASNREGLVSFGVGQFYALAAEVVVDDFLRGFNAE